MSEVPLKEYIERIFEEKDKALAVALTAVKEENRKTEVAAEKRFELLNELRGDVATKTQIQALEKLVGDHQTRLDTIQGRDTGLSMGWGKLIGSVGLISTVLGIFYLLSK